MLRIRRVPRPVGDKIKQARACRPAEAQATLFAVMVKASI